MKPRLAMGAPRSALRYWCERVRARITAH